MKKFLLLVTCILAISTAAIAGCSGTNMGTNDSSPDNSYNLVKSGECEPNDDGTVKPEPRTPHAERRTSDNDGNCEDDDCDDNENDCPICRKPRRTHDGNGIHPIPRPAPIKPKN